METEEITKSGIRGILHEYRWLFFWIAVAALFFAGIWVFLGRSMAIDFASGYIIEMSLSIDNLFVFLFIFLSFRIDEAAQHRVLGYGIAGTIILRFLFIFIGLSLVNRFEWILYVFGAILIYSGIKMAVQKAETKDAHESRMFRFFQKILPMTSYFADDRFFVKEQSKRRMTPLFAILLLVIFSDVLFAFDSVPAVISMTRNLFIVYTSNIFAVLGLRQLFFVIEHMQRRFEYVKYAVSVILVFTGVKMIIEIFGIHIENIVSICVICGLLGAGILVSVIVSKRQERLEKKASEEESA